MRILLIILFSLMTIDSRAQYGGAYCYPYENFKRTSSELSCNNKDILFVFVNGVNVKKKVAQDSLEKIGKLNAARLINPSQRPSINADPNKKYTELRAKLSYNFSFTESIGGAGIYLDVVEALAQLLIRGTQNLAESVVGTFLCGRLLEPKQRKRFQTLETTTPPLKKMPD